MQHSCAKPIEEVITMMDTERTKDQLIRKLREELQRYEEITGHIEEAIWTTSTDGQEVLFASAAFEKIWGYTPQEICARPSLWLEAVHEDDRDRVGAAFFGACAQWKEGIPADYEVAFRIIRSDGTMRWIRDRGFPVRDEQGAFVRIVGIAVDITKAQRDAKQLRASEDELTKAHAELELRVAERTTQLEQEVAERRQVEAALRESEGRFRELCNSLPQLVWTCQPDGPCNFLSKQWIDYTGVPAEEQLGYGWLEQLHPDDRESTVAAWQAAVDSGSDFFVEFRIRRHDGEYRPFDTRAVRLRDAHGHTVRWVGSNTDITERKQAEERQRNFEAKLQQAQKLESLGVLAGGIAHDFNNLLMGVLGNAEIALLELPPESPARGELMNITTAALRAAELTKQMLAYSGKGKFVVEALNLSKVVEEMVHLLQVSISKNVVLKYHFSDDLPAIEADGAQIRQVVMNLIINASEAIGEKSGFVTVSTGVIEADRSYLSETYLDENLPEGYYVSLEVADTGCGMDEQTRKKIFDPFFSTKFAGRGLGLAAVLGIVRGHGGTLMIYSQPRRGTTFKVLFPASRLPVEGSVPSSATEQEWRGSGVILVVDDDEPVRIAAKWMLAKLGFTVLTAEDGRAALEVLRSRVDEIVVVLLDLTMPRLDGEGTFRELRRIRPDVRVILSSGYNEQETTSRFAGKGLAGFLQKPYGIRPLMEKIRQVLEAPPS